jgi:hypothetical protein
MTSTTFYFQPRSDKIERKQSGARASQQKIPKHHQKIIKT